QSFEEVPEVQNLHDVLADRAEVQPNSRRLGELLRALSGFVFNQPQMDADKRRFSTRHLRLSAADSVLETLLFSYG
ncbi:MAG: hypothetical protein ACKVHE_13910, partial [Planctomycetales bacterium]